MLQTLLWDSLLLVKPFLPQEKKMTSKLVSKENPIFKSKDSICTISLVTFEAVVICILEGIVIMNHLGLVQNCNVDRAGKGKKNSPI